MLRGVSRRELYVGLGVALCLLLLPADAWASTSPAASVVRDVFGEGIMKIAYVVAELAKFIFIGIIAIFFVSLWWAKGDEHKVKALVAVIAVLGAVGSVTLGSYWLAGAATL